MSANFKLEGLDDLRRALADLPDRLQADAESSVMRAAEQTASEVRSVYQSRRSATDTYVAKGGVKKARRHLADSVEVKSRSRETGAAVARVVVTAPHASWFEFGTQNRQWESGKSTGSSPARPTLIPAAVRERRQMVNELVAVVERAGFKVTGNA